LDLENVLSKPCRRGENLYTLTSLGGSDPPNPSQHPKVLWKVDSWNGGDLDLET
jgi:hypothetical protein